MIEMSAAAATAITSVQQQLGSKKLFQQILGSKDIYYSSHY